jgi:CxxC motif-containing protein
MGCQGRVVVDEKAKVIKAGNYQCKKGREYAQIEFKAPLRVLTTTVITEGGHRAMLPIRTDKPIPKNKLKDCVKALAKVKVKPPIKVGEVLFRNIGGTEADILATMTINKS